ncbi:MAG: MFS transporter [Oliverpabstia sp.]
MSKQKTLSEREYRKIFWAWPSRTISYCIGAALLGMVTYFATDFMGLSPATVGIIFMVSKIFDGFTDLVAGWLIDRTHTKIGKGRPYELALIGYWASMVLIYCAPEMGITASCVYLFVMYTLANSIFLTLLTTCEAVYLRNALEDQEKNVSIYAFSGFISLIFTMVAAMILPRMVDTMGTTRQGWTKIALILAIPFTIVGLIRFFVVKERADAIGSAQSKISLKEMISALGKNKYILILSIIILISNIGTNLVNTVTTYFYQYIIGNLSLSSVMSLAMLAIVIVIMITPALSKKFGFMKIMRITTLIGAVGYAMRLFDIDNLVLLFISTVLSMMGFYTFFSFTGTFIIDCMDYGEWKTGVRVEGAVTAVQSVASKIGTALGLGLVGLLMEVSGYNGTLAVQTNSANNMIIALFSFVPAIFCVVQYILLKVYDLDKMLPQIRKELAERRNGSESWF